MLNRDQLQELARFKVLLRKNCAESVQIERFLTDSAYQSQCLDRAEDSDDEELMMLAITLRARLGRLGAGDQAFLSEIPFAAHTGHALPTQAVAEPTSQPTIQPAMQPAMQPEKQAAAAATAAENANLPNPVAQTQERHSGGFWTKNRSIHVSANHDNGTPRYVNSLR